MSLEMYLDIIRFLRTMSTRLETSFDYGVTMQRLVILHVERDIDLFTSQIPWPRVDSISVFESVQSMAKDTVSKGFTL